MSATQSRQNAERRGRVAETWAALYLRAKFYAILARDYKTPMGEIDLIAKRGRTLAFVEVKRRANLAISLEAVSPRQQKRIARAAHAYVAQHPHLQSCDLRFDVIAIRRWRWPYHLKGAWMVSSDRG